MARPTLAILRTLPREVPLAAAAWTATVMIRAALSRALVCAGLRAVRVRVRACGCVCNQCVCAGCVCGCVRGVRVRGVRGGPWVGRRRATRILLPRGRRRAGGSPKKKREKKISEREREERSQKRKERETQRQETLTRVTRVYSQNTQNVPDAGWGARVEFE